MAKLQHFSEILTDVKRFIFPMIGWGIRCVRSVLLNIRTMMGVGAYLVYVPIYWICTMMGVGAYLVYVPFY